MRGELRLRLPRSYTREARAIVSRGLLLYEVVREIAEGKAKARELLEKQAHAAERSSVHFPVAREPSPAILERSLLRNATNSTGCCVLM